MNNTFDKLINDSMIKRYNSFYAPMKIEIKDSSEDIVFEEFIIHKMDSDEITKFLGIKYATIDEDGNPHDLCLNNDDSHHYKTLPHPIFGAKYLLISKNGEEYENNIENFLSAFRIYKCGDIFAPICFSANLNYTIYISPQFTRYQKIYRIKTSELEDVKKIYFRLKQSSSIRTKQLLQRFNNAISVNLSLENSFVELVSIIESVIVEEIFELKFRFSLYSAFILNNKCNYPITFKKIQEIYDVRSQLVHTGSSKKFNIDLLNQVSEITIRILNWFLSNDNGGNQVLKIIMNELKLS
jgi:hypothetical protein